MRDKVLGYGWHFSPAASSNSTRRPRLFDWTADPSQATVEVAVFMGAAIPEGLTAPGRKIAWVLESPAISEWQGTTPFIREHLDAVMQAYEFVLTSDRAFCARHPRILYHPAAANLPWVPENAYGLYRKDRLCSMFASAKTMVEGHVTRQRVAERLRHRLDLFGGAAGSPRIGGEGPHPDKRAGLLPYMFQVVMENAQVDFYYTEKLTDCFATGTVPVYWGSSCVGELFDPDGIIPFDDDFDVGSLSDERYFAMLPAVRNNLGLVRDLEGTDDLLYRLYVRDFRRRWVACPVALRRAPPPRVGPPTPSEGDPTDASVPWQPWDVGRARGGGAGPRMAPADRLACVREAEKATIVRAGDVPSDRVTTRAVRTWFEAPRTVHAPHPGDVGFPQLSRALLLHLGDAFVGDNVVFDAERHYTLGRWWLGSSWRQYAGTRDVRHVEAAASVGAWGGEAFQHFAVDALPVLASMLALLEAPELAHVSIVSHDEPDTAAQWFWDRLGLRDRIVAKPPNADAGFVVHAERVLAVHFEPNLDALGFYPRGCLRPVQHRLGLLGREPGDRVLYLRRTGARSVANEEDLLETIVHAIEGSGLSLEIFEGASGPGQGEEAFRRARIVVGPHGGAFANLVFAPPGTHVVEFVPWQALTQTRPYGRPLMYYGLCQAAAHRYWTVEPANYDHDRPGMRVSVADVAAILGHIAAER